MGPMTQCREQCRLARRTEIPQPMPELTHALPTPPGHHLLLTHYPLPTLLSILLPSWPDETIPFLDDLGLPLSSPPGNNTIKTLYQLNKVGEGWTDELLLEWTLDVLRSLEDWRWLWSQEPAATPLSFPTLSPPSPPLFSASNANPLNMFAPNVPSISAPFANEPPLVIPNELASCTLAPFSESLVMWEPLAQLQPQLIAPLSLLKWEILDDLELQSQGYEGGSVTVQEAPISFSLFSGMDCLLFSHFSFDDFILLAFLDLAKDLDVQI